MSAGRDPDPLPGGLPELLAELFPGSRVEEVRALAPDARTDDATAKAVGYGRPLRITLSGGAGGDQVVVLRTATANEYGHDRRSDRAEEILLDFDSWSRIPRHVRAVDVGAIGDDGRLISLRRAGELYLLSSYAAGRVYADDLRRIARAGQVTPLDEARCAALAGYLCDLHRDERPAPSPVRYHRAIRDLVGHGEGIFGIVDAYPADTPAAPPARLEAIERGCLAWRWRLKERAERLARTHGDFHPFNVVFRAGTDFTLLDASRGCAGDPADDVAAMAVNYVFFGLDHRAGWRAGLGRLWRRFWDGYLAGSGDAALLDVVAPFFAWRGLVVSSPRFYPALPAGARDAMLGLVERALAAPRFDPAWAEALFP